ncbi:unnamed protein product [Ectocarpus sp. CCAP 1310/34]|nr:unnamed protein product [Ectocarpus sp. CCAP 1310/34]
MWRDESSSEVYDFRRLAGFPLASSLCERRAGGMFWRLRVESTQNTTMGRDCPVVAALGVWGP